MKTQSYVLGLMTVLALSGCGHSMQMTQQGQALATQVKSDYLKLQTKQDLARLRADRAKKHQVELPLKDLSGKLTPVSDTDLKDMQGNLPYVDQDSPSQDIGNPSFVVKESRDGFVSGSNLIFRAVTNQLPAEANKNAITEVKSIVLKLRGVTLSADESITSASLANQMLCFFEKKTCIGTVEKDPSSNVNVTYSTTENAAFAAINKFATSNSVSPDSVDEWKIFSYQGASANTAATSAPLAELDLDLKSLLNLSSKDAIEWLYDNSVAYDTDGNTRKFRFVMGNNVYVKEGELEIELETDSKLLPASYVPTTVAPATQGDDSRVLSLASQAFTDVNDVIERVGEGVIKLDDTGKALDDASNAKVKDLADLLVQNEKSIQQVTVFVPAGSNLLASLVTAVLTTQTKDVGMKIEGANFPAKTPNCTGSDCIALPALEFRIDLKPKASTDDKNSIKTSLKGALDGIFGTASK